MSKYIDGFVLVVPSDKTEEYKKMAEGGRDLWIKHGALEYYECMGDDLKQQETEEMKSRSFVEMAGASAGETVWFSFIIFESKAHRDEVNTKVMAEMHEQMAGHEDMQVPFEMHKMAYGGFQAMVEGLVNSLSS